MTRGNPLGAPRGTAEALMRKNDLTPFSPFLRAGSWGQGTRTGEDREVPGPEKENGGGQGRTKLPKDRDRKSILDAPMQLLLTIPKAAFGDF